MPFPGAPTICAAFLHHYIHQVVNKVLSLVFTSLAKCEHLDAVLIILYVAKRSYFSIVKRMNGKAGGPQSGGRESNNSTRGVPINDRQKSGEVQDCSSLSLSPSTNIMGMRTMKATEQLDN